MAIVLAAACVPREPPAALWFGGDVHLGESARGDLQAITAMLGGAAGVVNLEGPVGGGPGLARVTGDTVLLGNPASAPGFLRDNGVVAASIANNHALDAGPEGPDHTAAALRTAGVSPVGGPAGPARVEVGGVPVTLLAHDLGEPSLAGDLDRELASAGEVAVVSLYVTGPPSYLPTPALEAAVARAIRGGADVVVAHGTHVVGPVERRGDTVIAWGLGNLLFDCACTDASEAIVLRVAFTPTGAGVAEVVPVLAGLGGAPAVPAPDPDGILDLLDALGRPPLARLGGRGRILGEE